MRKIKLRAWCERHHIATDPLSWTLVAIVLISTACMLYPA